MDLLESGLHNTPRSPTTARVNCYNIARHSYGLEIREMTASPAHTNHLQDLNDIYSLCIETYWILKTDIVRQFFGEAKQILNIVVIIFLRQFTNIRAFSKLLEQQEIVANDRLKGLEFESSLHKSENKEIKVVLNRLDNVMKRREIEVKPMNEALNKLVDDRKRETDGFFTCNDVASRGNRPPPTAASGFCGRNKEKGLRGWWIQGRFWVLM